MHLILVYITLFGPTWPERDFAAWETAGKKQPTKLIIFSERYFEPCCTFCSF